MYARYKEIWTLRGEARGSESQLFRSSVLLNRERINELLNSYFHNRKHKIFAWRFISEGLIE